MRVRAEIRESHHKDVIKAASRLLRLKGVEGLSIAVLMRSEGMTHGGFYRHFKSKTALVEAAIDDMFAPFIKMVIEDAKSLGPGEAVNRYVDRYLSADHVAHPEMGCPIAAFSTEALRLKFPARKAFAAHVAKLKDGLARGLKPATHETADALLSLLVGAVVLARSAPDAETATRGLKAARRHAQTFLN